MAEIKTKNKEEKFVVIDGKDLILGRLGSNISKRLLLGESISIINCKDVVILGRKKVLVDRYKLKLSNNVTKQGPYYSRGPLDIVKRAFRNMLPYKNQRGVDAFKRVKCYNSIPRILESVKSTTLEDAKMDDTKVFYYTRIEEISRGLGYNKEIK